MLLGLSPINASAPETIFSAYRMKLSGLGPITSDSYLRKLIKWLRLVSARLAISLWINQSWIWLALPIKKLQKAPELLTGHYWFLDIREPMRIIFFLKSQILYGFLERERNMYLYYQQLRSC